MTSKAILELLRAINAGSVRPVDFISMAMAVFPAGHSNALLAYNGSLDAAKKLHDAVLLDWVWLIDDAGNALIWNPKKTRPENASNEGIKAISLAGPSRAWLIAILRALLAQQEAVDAATKGTDDE